MTNDIDELTVLNRDFVASVQNSDVRRFDEILAPEFYCSNPGPVDRPNERPERGRSTHALARMAVRARRRTGPFVIVCSVRLASVPALNPQPRYNRIGRLVDGILRDWGQAQSLHRSGHARAAKSVEKNLALDVKG